MNPQVLSVVVFVGLVIVILLAWEWGAWWLDVTHSPLGFGDRESVLPWNR